MKITFSAATPTPDSILSVAARQTQSALLHGSCPNKMFLNHYLLFCVCKSFSIVLGTEKRLYFEIDIQHAPKQ